MPHITSKEQHLQKCIESPYELSLYAWGVGRRNSNLAGLEMDTLEFLKICHLGKKKQRRINTYPWGQSLSSHPDLTFLADDP